MSEFVKVSSADHQLVAAVREGRVIGEIYKDGEVWVDLRSYMEWRTSQYFDPHKKGDLDLP